MRKKIIIGFLLILIFTFFFPIIGSNSNNIAHAWGGIDWEEFFEEQGYNYEEIMGQHSGTVTRSPLAEDGERFYYRLEAEMPDEDKAKWYNLPGKTRDLVITGINEAIMTINKIIFWINTQVGKFTIGLLESANEFKFIDSAIEKISSHVKKLVGISGNNFSSTGMFSPIIQFVALLVVIYAFYQLVWKRSFVSSFGELLKFIVVLATSLLLFSNYSTFLSGMNDLSREVGEFIVGSSGTVTSSQQESRIATFSETLWEHFVDRTYLTLQYGTTDFEEIGDGDFDAGVERVRELLKARTGSLARSHIIDNEVNELGNYHMTYDSVVEKTALNITFLMINIFTSIPVLIIGLAIMFTQIWFVIIGLIAPFALLIASFPTQFNVIKRYFFELSLPLLVKVGLHFVLVLIMFLTSLITEVGSDIGSDMFSGHIGTAFVNAIFYGMLFFGIFILRKRIVGILTSGSKMMGEIRAGMSSVTTKPAKKGVQTVATVGGGAIGLMAGGPAGMAMGVNIGSKVGKIVTGESGGVSGVTQDLGRLAYQHQVMKGMSKNKTSNQDADQISNRTGINENYHQEVKQGTENVEQFTKNLGMSNERSDALLSKMKSEGIDLSKVKKQTLERANISEKDRVTSPVDYKERVEKGINSLNDFAKTHSLNENHLRVAMENEGVDFARLDSQLLESSKIRGEEINNPKEFAQRVKRRQELRGTAFNDPTEFVQNIKKHQEMEAMKVVDLRNRRIEKFDNYLKEQNLNSTEIEEIYHHLDKKGIDIAKIPTSDYIKANQKIRTKLEKGETVNYTDEFNKNLDELINERKLKEQRKRILNENQPINDTQERHKLIDIT